MLARTVVPSFTHALPSTQQIAQLIAEVADPRGRCNARGLQRSTVYLLGLQIGIAVTFSALSLSFEGGFATLLNIVFCWIGFTLVSKRLHDIGRAAWWFAAGAGIWVAFTVLICASAMLTLGMDALDEGTTARVVMLAATIIPLFATLVWLHVIPGDVDANRFGPAPDARGFAMPMIARFTSASPELA